MRSVVGLMLVVSFSSGAFATGGSLVPTRPQAQPELLAPAAADKSLALSTLTAGNVFLKFMLEASGQTPETKLRIFDEATKFLIAFAAQKPEIRTVSTVEELAKLREELVISSLGLADELIQRRAANLPPKIVVQTRSPKVLAELKRLQTSQLERIAKLSEHKIPLDLSDRSAPEVVADLLSRFGVDTTTILGLAAGAGTLQANPQKYDKAKLALVGLFELGFESAISEIRGVGTRLAKSDQLQLPNEVLQTFFQIIIGEYFKGLNRSTIKDMINTIIDHPEKADTDLGRFEVMVQNAGPQFQKLFQVYARQDGFSEELKETFQQLENAVRPVPWIHIEEIISQHSFPFEIIDISEKPIGVGTMAQVHKAKIRRRNGRVQEIVIRVIKPGIEEKLAMDTKILREVARVMDANPILRAANFPLMTPFLEEIEEMARLEKNVDVTTANQLKGRRIYKSTEEVTVNGVKSILEVRVPNLIKLAKGGSLMAIDFVKSKSFEEFAATEPVKARLAAEHLARLWMEHALVAEGFFHTDLHQGNIRVGLEDGKTVLNVLDFGMTGKLSRGLQNKFLAFGVVSLTNDPALMARSLWDLSVTAQNKITKQQLEKRMAEKVAELKAQGHATWPMPEWVSFAVNEGIKFPADFTRLNRGVVLVFKMLASLGSQKTLPGELKSLLIRQPSRLAAVLSETPTFTYKEWSSIVWTVFKNRKLIAESSAAPGAASALLDSAKSAGRASGEALRCEMLFAK